MRRCRQFVLGVLFVVVSAVGAAAATLYVTDQLRVSVRQAPDDAAAPLESLRSGQAVAVLAEEGRFLKVRLEDGRQGYVLKQYFTAEAPRRARLEQLEQERDRLKTQLVEAQQQVQAAGASPAGDAELQRLLEQTRQELAAAKARQAEPSADAEQLELLRRDLEQSRSEVARLEAELQAQKEETARRYATAMIPWFLAGGGVLLVGWMMGKASRPKRRF